MKSTYRLNRSGDSGPPCLTPLFVSNLLSGVSINAVVVLDYRVSSSEINFLEFESGKRFFIVSNIISLGIWSKAAVKSTKSAYIIAFF